LPADTAARARAESAAARDSSAGSCASRDWRRVLRFAMEVSLSVMGALGWDGVRFMVPVEGE